MPSPRIVTAFALLALFAFGHPTAAQNTFTFALFERYLNALREQAGIPGLAAAVVQDGAVVWERGFGVATIDTNTAVAPDTPFPVTQLTQTVAASLFVRHCIESGRVSLDDRLQRWSPAFPDRTATVRQVMSHTTGGSFEYREDRFAYLTTALEECSGRPYPLLVYDEVISRLGMGQAVPGGEVAINGTAIRQMFPVPTLNAFRQTLSRLATPYRVDRNRRAMPSLYQVSAFNASSGLVASVRDMARWEAALDAGAIVRQRTLESDVWVRSGQGPMGLGWFVQEANGRRVVWHFGIAGSAYSSLVIKVPAQGTTLILLANSDGLSAQFPLANGDVTVSPFARIFFSLLG